MRWIVVAAIFALSAGGLGAADLAAPENQAPDVPAPVVGEAAVTVTAIPSHATADLMVRELSPSPEMRPSKKLSAAQKKALPKSLLSRTERHQLALMVARPKSGEPSLLGFLSDEDAGSGSDDLDLQRSYSRPRLVEAEGQEDEGTDQGLSDAVKLRLFLARMKAVRAHEKRFS